MPKAYDLTNQRFGKLVAQYKCNYKKGNKYPWHCICDCGNEVDVRTQDLITNKTTSCGCLQKEIVSQIGKKTIKTAQTFHANQLLGKKFGQLTVVENTYKIKNHCYIWKCLCDCGNITYVKTNDLTSGNTISCGCIVSKGQYLIKKLLLENNIPFKTEHICYNKKHQYEQRFDFYINNSYFIEYDGLQHYQETYFFNTSLKEQQLKDVYKNQWCKDNNIPLIRIPYWHLKKLKIEDLLLETSDFII